MKVLILNACIDQENDNFEELKQLAIACNYNVVCESQQNIKEINKKYYIGKGKVEAIKPLLEQHEVELVIFNNELSPLQSKNLQDEWKIEVIDRTILILNIFALRAKTREAKLQVELARLNYMLPRLVMKNANYEQQTGGSVHNKGSGEKQIDLDRKHIKNRINKLSQEIEEIEKQKNNQNKNRYQKNLPLVALVGYTNSGKSTLMNTFLSLYGNDNEDKKVFEKDMLFATLETSVRKIKLPDNKEFLLSDTVGFVSSLPHGLVKAFRSTLSEVVNADLIINVVDISDSNFLNHIFVTEQTLLEIGVENKPIITVFNKIDKLDVEQEGRNDFVVISAKNAYNINELISVLTKKLFTNYLTCKMFFPYEKGDIVSYLNDKAYILEQRNVDDGIFLTLECSSQDYKKFFDYVWVDSKN